ncbi:hypothetical protein VC83_08601 [Pseudogymnoascus destructans]|uniref:Uncharacterized protein n=1 Tax=Pseudogymnoascus destructans TaxID=655981 RepID=A0A177A1L2_9PEZI|nr:uncharacterized protein VC83_08601 [Pseudogymnoascus destructans]OAF54834.1 hypothetical protein VC83_08601 [Pseudogymnoascus destructans]
MPPAIEDDDGSDQGGLGLEESLDAEFSEPELPLLKHTQAPKVVDDVNNPKLPALNHTQAPTEAPAKSAETVPARESTATRDPKEATDINNSNMTVLTILNAASHWVPPGTQTLGPSGVMPTSILNLGVDDGASINTSGVSSPTDKPTRQRQGKKVYRGNIVQRGDRTNSKRQMNEPENNEGASDKDRFSPRGGQEVLDNERVVRHDRAAHPYENTNPDSESDKITTCRHRKRQNHNSSSNNMLYHSQGSVSKPQVQYQSTHVTRNSEGVAGKKLHQSSTQAQKKKPKHKHRHQSAETSDAGNGESEMYQSDSDSSVLHDATRHTQGRKRKRNPGNSRPPAMVLEPSEGAYQARELDVIHPLSVNGQAGIVLLEGVTARTDSQARLLAMPRMRELRVRSQQKSINLRDEHNREAVFAQVVGTLSKVCCERCEAKNGPFTECVVVDRYFYGACAGCRFNRM